MTLPPEWFEAADEIIQKIADERKKEVGHFLQSNMLAYGRKWNRVLAEMFGNSVGSSMDFPNLHRRLKNAGPRNTTESGPEHTAGRRGRHPSGSHIHPNEQTFELGAERFYVHFVEDLGLRDFQINTPFQRVSQRCEEGLSPGPP